MGTSANYLWFDQVGMGDIATVGGKNASLGEMISNLSTAGVQVPFGFATTSESFNQFISSNNIREHLIQTFKTLDIEDIKALQKAGSEIRAMIMDACFSDTFIKDISSAYSELVEKCGSDATFAVRSSATAEDLPTASFAGQQETFLNVSGIDNILTKIKSVYASLFNDRAISYRVHHNFNHLDVSISVGVQQMVRSDLSSSGVMFTLDTESGYDGVVYITSSYGLGEAVVSGAVNPDEFYVDKSILARSAPSIIRKIIGSKAIKMIYKGYAGLQTVEVASLDQQTFSLSNEDIVELAKLAVKVEAHYKMAMDIEWAKDGITGKLFILQARPETVESNKQNSPSIEKFVLKSHGELITTGRSVGSKIGAGKACVLTDVSSMHDFVKGDVLVADMTDPDWEPIMKKASAIVTNRGGRTCHAAIIARELGIPAVVGCEDATSLISDSHDVTVSCAEGDDGKIFAGIADFECNSHQVNDLPTPPVEIMLNIGNPDNAFNCHKIPCDGVGLARLEFIINNNIGIHPNAVLNPSLVTAKVQKQIQAKIAGYKDPKEFYEQKLIEGISTIASVFHPKTVIVRMSDFKSNEYANLIGGETFEPTEENPMIGFRGAVRYLSPDFRKCFEMECNAIKYVRKTMGLDNVKIMIPFVRTLEQARDVISLLKEFGIERGKDGMQIIMMCEVPSNVILADEFLEYFDGFSIGSNDLTQLVLGLDRDSASIAHLFDERDLAIKKMISIAINACLRLDKYIGICGQAPSDYPDFAKWLVTEGIKTISLNPDSVLDTTISLAK